MGVTDCEACGGRRWLHCSPEGDPCRYWIERCDNCSEHLNDDEAAILAAAQIGGFPAMAISGHYTVAAAEMSAKAKQASREVLDSLEPWIWLVDPAERRWHAYLEGVPDEWIHGWEPRTPHETAPSPANPVRV